MSIYSFPQRFISEQITVGGLIRISQLSPAIDSLSETWIWGQTQALLVLVSTPELDPALLCSLSLPHEPGSSSALSLQISQTQMRFDLQTKRSRKSALALKSDWVDMP